MDKLLRSKVFLVVFALPIFAFVMIGERYEAIGQSWRDPFSWRGQALEFWGELIDSLTGRRDAYFSKGIRANRRYCLKKIRRRARKHLASAGYDEAVLSLYDVLTSAYADTNLWFDLNLRDDDRPTLYIRTFSGVNWSRSNYYFEYKNDQWLFVHYNDDQWKGTGDDKQLTIDDVYHCRRRKAYIPVSREDMDNILDRFTRRNGQSWCRQVEQEGVSSCT